MSTCACTAPAVPPLLSFSPDAHEGSTPVFNANVLLSVPLLTSRVVTLKSARAAREPPGHLEAIGRLSHQAGKPQCPDWRQTLSR